MTQLQVAAKRKHGKKRVKTNTKFLRFAGLAELMHRWQISSGRFRVCFPGMFACKGAAREGAYTRSCCHPARFLLTRCYSPARLNISGVTNDGVVVLRVHVSNLFHSFGESLTLPVLEVQRKCFFFNSLSCAYIQLPRSSRLTALGFVVVCYRRLQSVSTVAFCDSLLLN